MMVLEEKRAALKANSIQYLNVVGPQRLPTKAAESRPGPRPLALREDKRQKRGLLKDKIMAALHAAGSRA